VDTRQSLACLGSAFAEGLSGGPIDYVIDPGIKHRMVNPLQLAEEDRSGQKIACNPLESA
jgi:hypothetical protein